MKRCNTRLFYRKTMTLFKTQFENGCINTAYPQYGIVGKGEIIVTIQTGLVRNYLPKIYNAGFMYTDELVVVQPCFEGFKCSGMQVFPGLMVNIDIGSISRKI